MKGSRNPLSHHTAVERSKFALEYVEDFNVRRPVGVYPHKLEITRGIDGWAIANLCFCGLEQAMKLVIRSRCSDDKIESLIKKDKHDLTKLYNKIGFEEKETVASFYRVYHSLYQRTSEGPSCDTIEAFIRQIGNDYVAWHYTLTEDQQHPPKVYARYMIEIWRCLLRIVGGTWCAIIDFHSLDQRISKYLETNVFQKAADETACMKGASDNYWHVVDEWVEERGGYLEAGLHVFRHLQKPDKFRIGLKEELHEQVLKLARESIKKRDPQTMYLDGHRLERFEELVVLNNMCGKGMEWNREKGIFIH